MEENKEIKKKKMPLYLIAIAIVLAVLGVMDLKVNAAELLHFNYIKFGIDRGGNGSNHVMIDKEFSYTKPVYFYYWYTDPTANRMEIQSFMLSEEPINNIDTSTINCNGKNYYCYSLYTSSYGTATSSILLESNGTTTTYIRKLNSKFTGSEQDFISMHLNDTLDYERPPIDYDNLEIDNDMLVPKDLKRNVLTFVDKSQFSNVANPQLGQWLTYNYDYVTWTNTSSQYRLQLQIIPMVQFYSQSLAFGNVFDNEFIGNWITKEVFEDITNSYSKNTYIPMVQHEDEESYLFYENCLNDYDADLKTKSYLYFGYRIRYVDVDNLKAGPWLELIPTHTFDEYESNIRYSDDTTENNGGANGSTNTFDPNDTTLEDAKEQIDTENEFKDKYDVLDGNADVGEITNWLNSVTGFIKSSPSVIGSVLSFLPQPILYGLYVTVSLGVIATAIGILKALF